MTDWFLQQVIADQVRKERDELKQKITTAKPLLAAARSLVEAGLGIQCLDLLREVERLLVC